MGTKVGQRWNSWCWEVEWLVLGVVQMGLETDI
jgi:hypothetical protein